MFYMPIGAGDGQLIPVLIAVFESIRYGLIVSCFAFISHTVHLKLSRHTPIEEPDPTIYKRQFEYIFDAYFTPIGRSTAERIRSPLLGQITFQTSIGLMVIVTALATYLITAGLLVGVTLATYQAFGVVIKTAPLFRYVVAFVVVGTVAVMFHAGERAKQMPA